MTLPRAGNLGGGGFMLDISCRIAKQTIAIDYREKAPLAATRDMFLDEKGEADARKIEIQPFSSWAFPVRLQG